MWLGRIAENPFNFCNTLIFLPFNTRNPEFAVIDFENRFFRGTIQLRDPPVRYTIGAMGYSFHPF
jgi:hypothetical protein